MLKIAVISAILECPQNCQEEFNKIVSSFRGNIKGRMGIPCEKDISVISITVIGTLQDINLLTEKLEGLKDVTVKCAIAKKEI